MADRILPKSLHTITVLENLARFMLRGAALVDRPCTPAKAIEEALAILKLDAMPDTHGLVAATLKKLEASRG